MLKKLSLLSIVLLILAACNVPLGSDDATVTPLVVTATPEESAELPEQPVEATEEPADDGEIITLYVAPYIEECVGVGPQECLLVREDPNADWELFYDSIDGFEYLPGNEYELLVRKTEIEDPPADASSIRWELVEVVSQNDIQLVEDDSPQLVRIDEVDYQNGVVSASGWGRALFEGGVAVEVLDADSNQLAIAPTIVDAPDAGTGGEGPWEIEIPLALEPGAVVTVHAFAESARDGSIVAEDSVKLAVE